MSVSVDTVYKTVLLILNKEQRGYMTPDEFNKIGSQVQREIFERYFEDINQQVRIQQSEFDYANRIYNTDEKISEFKTESNISQSAATNPPFNKYFSLPSDLYRLGSLTYSGGEYPVEIQRLTRNEYYNVNKSPLTRPTISCPVYLQEDNKIMVFPNDGVTGKVKVQYVKKPEDIRWGYTVGDIGQYIYSPYPYNPNSINIGDITPYITSNSTTAITNGVYTVTSFSVTPTGGTGVEFSVEVIGNSISTIQVTNPGTGFNVGDVISILGSSLPGPGVGTLEIQLTSDNLFSGSQQGYIDFGLHNSERPEIVKNILLYYGVVIRDPQIIQTAISEINKEEVNEKQ